MGKTTARPVGASACNEVATWVGGLVISGSLCLTFLLIRIFTCGFVGLALGGSVGFGVIEVFELQRTFAKGKDRRDPVQVVFVHELCSNRVIAII
jgi:hypothetical protein